MDKKEYVAPETEILAAAREQLLAGSPQLDEVLHNYSPVVSEDDMDGDDMFAKDSSFGVAFGSVWDE